jgi:mannitol/fructose-specific phosphotransferase system IIA component (Ntr-type)
MAAVVDLSRMLAPERCVDLLSTTKVEALREMVEVLAQAREVADKEEFLQALLSRERIMSTGIGLGIAVPHARTNAVKDFVIAVGRSRAGLPYDSLDDKPVQVLVLIGGPETEKEQFLRVISRVVLFLKRPENLKRVLEAPAPSDLCRLLAGG